VTEPIRDDRVAIIESLAELAASFDHRDWDASRALMCSDVEAYGHSGVDAVIDNNLRAHLGGCGPSQHLLGNHRIAIDGAEATSVTYARVFHQGIGEHSGKSFECFGEYHDTWKRRDSVWLLASRRFEIGIVLGDFEVLQPG
jgi:hypothetical protein